MKRHLFAPRRRHSVSLRTAHRGLTLLEIMIVIAILGLVMGIFVVPAVMERLGESKTRLARLAVEQFSYSDGPQWAVTTGKDCPPDLLTIAQFRGKGPEDIVDPWGTPYKLFCKGRDTMPPGATGSFAVMSSGPDKKEGTEDDIKSWDKK